MHRSFPAAGLFVSLSSRLIGSKASCAADTNNQATISYSSSEQLIIPLPPTIDSKKGGNFTVVYDKRTRNPKYVVERITKESLLCADDEDALSKKKKRKPFHAENSIENDIFRVSSPFATRNTLLL
jgi:DNA/RNA endonuclease G (NUC1)